MIEAFIILGALWLAVTRLIAASLRDKPPPAPIENRPVWTWPLTR